MKKFVFLSLLAVCIPLAVSAQADDDFSDFMEEELEDFDRFISEADRDFVRFLRSPWKKYEVRKPEQKRIKPEPVKPVVYDPSHDPVGRKPACLAIEEILDLTTGEGGRKPVTQVTDVEDIDFGRPGGVIVKPKDNAPVVIIEEEEVVENPPAEDPSEQPDDRKPPVTVEPVEEDEPPVHPVVPPAGEEPVLPGGSGGGESLRVPAEGTMRVDYMGQTFYLDNSLQGVCRLRALDENAVADAYETMLRADSRRLLAQCAQLAHGLRLNGWGTYTLLRAVADAGCRGANESVLMQQFLLNRMGYKARVARQEGRQKLLLFVALDCTVYAMPYMEEGGMRYYVVNAEGTFRYYMCSKDAPTASQAVDMHLAEAPSLQGAVSHSTHTGKRGLSATVGVPEGLMAFYKAYPQCDYSVYATASVETSVEHALLSSLAPYVDGKSEAEAVELLLNYVQTGFDYATDGEQFGYEKPFFVEEAFYYPRCDCEDRSILFAYLVRKLVGLDVVYLDYPDHIATAVCFNGQVQGDYLMVDGRRYTVCDPTYIGASIGMTMPAYRSVAAKVLKYSGLF